MPECSHILLIPSMTPSATPQRGGGLRPSFSTANGSSPHLPLRGPAAPSSPLCRSRARPASGIFRLPHGRAWSMIPGVARAKPKGRMQAAPASTSIWTSNFPAEKRPNGASAPVSNSGTRLSGARHRVRLRLVSFLRRLAVPSAETSRRRAFFPFRLHRDSGGPSTMRAEGERSASMSSPCHSLDQVVAEILRIVDEDKAASRRADDGAEYFFRGEQRNYKHPGSPVLDTAFDSCIDRFPAHWKHERELYEEAMRLNVASFMEDHTMCERLARMQHYRLPTRFADLSINALLSTIFACGGRNTNPGATIQRNQSWTNKNPFHRFQPSKPRASVSFD